MKKKHSFFLIFFLVFISAAFPQLKQANKYYENYDYAKAIPLYKKVVKKKENIEALEKLANSYRLVKDYQNAEIYYARLVKNVGIPPINYFYYGNVLKNNNKIDESKEQYKQYAAFTKDEKKAEQLIKSVDEVKIWFTNSQAFEVSLLPNINTSRSEFSPVIFKNQLVFCSAKSTDLVNDNRDTWDDQPYLNVLSSEYKIAEDGTLTFSKKAKSFSWRINSEYHDGPACFNAEQNTMYITRVNYILNKKDKNFVNRPKLYVSKLKGNNWGELMPFAYNSDLYTVQHPSINAEGDMLYFSSDMPGGFGGMDIYVCRKNGEGWSTPENLGADINTAGNEVFPYVRKDGMIYFSSDGHNGFGGLDIFSAAKVDKTSYEVKNLGAPLNASTDDFGIFYTDDYHKGYFSSNRKGGKGSDDIYTFNSLKKFIAVSGKVLLSENINDPAMRTKVVLLNKDNKVLMISNTDSTGFFIFNDLDPDQKYMVRLDENDPSFVKRDKFYLADEKGNIVRVTVVNDKGEKFVFMNLPADANDLQSMPLENDFSIAGNILVGDNPSTPLVNKKINLYNDKGDVLASTTTNEFGAFVFSNLPHDQNFLVKVAEEEGTKIAANTKVIITNRKGKEVQTTTADVKGNFVFEFLAAENIGLMDIENATDVAIVGNLFAGENPSKPMGNKVVYLVNEKGEVIKTVRTNENGTFVFKNLPPEHRYLVKIDESDADLVANTKIVITSKTGAVYKTTYVSETGKFDFTFLAGDNKSLEQMIVDETELRFDFVGKLFADDKIPIAKTIINLVNAKGEVLKTSTTKEDGSFQFINLPVGKDLQFTVLEGGTTLKSYTKLYITDKFGNIIKEFIQDNGEFKFTLLPNDQNKMGDFYVDDPWLKVLQFGKKDKIKNETKFDFAGNLLGDNKQPIENAVINLIDSKGIALQSSKTNKGGSFLFYDLPLGQELEFEVVEDGAILKSITKLYITDSKGKIIKEIIRDNGEFKFKLLPNDQNKLKAIQLDDTFLVKNKTKGKQYAAIIENIYYDYGKAELLPEAKTTLDKVINLMKNDAQLYLVLESHTDCHSSYGFNIKLSRERSKVAVDYIIAGGVNEKRLRGKGFGETQLINKCKDGVNCSDDEHAKNRRTEFKVTRRN